MLAGFTTEQATATVTMSAGGSRPEPWLDLMLVNAAAAVAAMQQSEAGIHQSSSTAGTKSDAGIWHLHSALPAVKQCAYEQNIA
jgi:hypothetical protein